jgi:hypothetical protein
MRALLFTAALGAAATATAPGAHAQRRDGAVDLARAAIHEAGFDVTEDEVAAIYAVALARSDGDLRRQMRRFFRGETTRPFALWLRRDGREPWLWPTSMSWSRYRDRWMAVLEVADRVVAGEITHRCAAPPMFWGGPGIDDEHALDRQFVEVSCGRTSNRYFISRAAYEELANANLEIDPE